MLFVLLVVVPLALAVLGIVGVAALFDQAKPAPSRLASGMAGLCMLVGTIFVTGWLWTSIK